MNSEDVEARVSHETAIQPTEAKNYRLGLGVFWLGMVLVLGFAQWVVPTLDALIPGMRSEYRPLEILSRAFLLTGVLASAAASNAAVMRSEEKIGAAFFVMLLAMVLSEGNFLPNTVLPIFVLPLGITLFMKLQGVDKTACRSLVGAAFVLSLGFAADIVDDLLRAMKYNLIGTVYIPAVIEEFSKFEELLEAIGAVLVTQAAVSVARQRLSVLVDVKKTALWIVLASLLVLSTGNALLHFQYEPGLALRVAGALLSFGGAAGVVYVDMKYLRGAVFATQRRGLAPAGLFVAVFVMLPLLHGPGSRILSSLFWVPVLAGLSYYLLLYRNRMSETARQEAVKSGANSRDGRAA